MFNNKLFKNTDKRKFFVSDELKILSANGSSVILVDTMDQEWRINTNTFFSFVLENKVKIEDNILKGRVVIDCNMSMQLPQAFYEWTQTMMEHEKIEKFDLIPGNEYILENGTTLIYLDTKFIGEIKFSANLIEQKKIYKKHVFVSINEGSPIYPSNYYLYDNKNLPKFISFKNTDIDVKRHIDLLKMIRGLYYYSDIKATEKALEFKQITVEEIVSKTEGFNLYFDLLFDFYDESLIGSKTFEFKSKTERTILLKNSDSYFDLFFKNKADYLRNSIYQLKGETRRKLDRTGYNFIVPNLD